MSTPAPAPRRTGVVLMNYGGPERAADAEAYLRNIFNDKYILDTIPGLLRPFAARFIARRRAPYTRANFDAIGGGSPLNKFTEMQRAALARELAARGHHATVEVAQRYWTPRAETAARALAAQRLTDLVLLPLYPQYAKATTRSSVEDFLRAWEREAPRDSVAIHVIDRFPTDPAYVDAVVHDLRAAIAAVPAERRGTTALVFSAHGVPLRSVERGETYPLEVRATVEAVLAALGFGGPAQLYPDTALAGTFVATHAERDPLAVAQARLAFQSRVGPLQWIRPYMEDTIAELAASGITDAVVYPITFVSDHSETLYEIELFYGAQARARGIEWHRVPALNDAPRFIGALAGLVERALGGSAAG